MLNSMEYKAFPPKANRRARDNILLAKSPILLLNGAPEGSDAESMIPCASGRISKLWATLLQLCRVLNRYCLSRLETALSALHHPETFSHSLLHRTRPFCLRVRLISLYRGLYVWLVLPWTWITGHSSRRLGTQNVLDRDVNVSVPSDLYQCKWNQTNEIFFNHIFEKEFSQW